MPLAQARVNEIISSARLSTNLPKAEQQEPKVQMLRRTYDNEADIPDNLKGAYLKGTDGKYHLDRLEEGHPLVVKKNELLTANSTLSQNNQTLTREKEALTKDAVPAGKVVVDAADAELVNKIKPLAGSAFDKLDDVPKILKEHKPLQEKVQLQERESKLVDLAKAMGWKEDSAKLLLKNLIIPEFSVRDVENEKKEKVPTAFALVPQSQGSQTMVEKSFSEYVESTPELKALLPALVNTNGGQAAPQTGQTKQTTRMAAMAGGSNGSQQGATSPTASMLQRNYPKPGAEAAKQ
jgi:hypothetical protein